MVKPNYYENVLYHLVNKKRPQNANAEMYTKGIKVLSVLASAEFPLTSHTIANTTDMKHEHVCDTLKNDRYSVSSFLIESSAKAVVLDTRPVKQGRF